jgi:hypothetical protein
MGLDVGLVDRPRPMPQSTLAGVGEGNPELDMAGELEGEVEKLDVERAGEEKTESKEGVGEKVALDRVGEKAELERVGEGVNSFCSRRGAGGDMEAGLGGRGAIDVRSAPWEGLGMGK